MGVAVDSHSQACKVANSKMQVVMIVICVRTAAWLHGSLFMSMLSGVQVISSWWWMVINGRARVEEARGFDKYAVEY